MARTLPATLLSLLLLLLFASPGNAVAPAGEQRLLILRLTWGPETPELSEDAVASSVERASEHIRASSYGRAWLTHETTRWLHVWDAEPRTCSYTELYNFTSAVAQRSGYDLGRYTYQVFVFPRIAACTWGGSYYGNVVWINWAIPWTTLAHELGHTYGLPEEGPARIGGEVVNYENPFSVMGHGEEQFTAWEKWVFGWLDGVARPGRTGTYELDALEQPSSRTQALAVTTGRAEYWFEYRPAHGVLAYAGTNGLRSGLGGPYSQRDVLVDRDVGTLRVPGVFEVRVVAREAEHATLAFRWLDRTRPARPRVRVRRGVVEWDPVADRGSGVARYEVHAGGRVRSVPATFWIGRTHLDADTRAARPAQGSVRVVAIDRAGNRSR